MTDTFEDTQVEAQPEKSFEQQEMLDLNFFESLLLISNAKILPIGINAIDVIKSRTKARFRLADENDRFSDGSPLNKNSAVLGFAYHSSGEPYENTKPMYVNGDELNHLGVIYILQLGDIIVLPDHIFIYTGLKNEITDGVTPVLLMVEVQSMEKYASQFFSGNTELNNDITTNLKLHKKLLKLHKRLVNERAIQKFGGHINNHEFEILNASIKVMYLKYYKASENEIDEATKYLDSLYKE